MLQKIKSNAIVKFISSVKLAVPLLSLIIVATTAGTLYESYYNADYAKLKVYGTPWFLFLMGVLWLNIFGAALVRFPFKKSQYGFAITHLGLLSLLAGGLVTSRYGTDGSLRVEEKKSGNLVFLQDLELVLENSVTGAVQKVGIPQKSEVLEMSDLQKINNSLPGFVRVSKYFPFATISKTFVADPSGKTKNAVLNFQMKSPMFQTVESLNTFNKFDIQMGPAHILLKSVQSFEEVPEDSSGNDGKPARIRKKVNPRMMASNLDQEKKSIQHSSKSAAGKTGKKVENNQSNDENTDTLEILDAASKAKLHEVKISELLKKPIKYKDLQIKLKKAFRHASVVENSLSEGDPASPMNPALEVEITKGTETQREVLYQKFTDFRLHGQGTFGYFLKFNGSSALAENLDSSTNSSGDTEAMGPHATASSESVQGDSENSQSSNSPPTESENPAMRAMRGGNTIHFYLQEGQDKEVLVVLSKQGKQVLRQKVAVGQTLQTPWMGMTITPGSILFNQLESETLSPAELIPKSPLPPSALSLKVTGSDTEIPLLEGEPKSINTEFGNYFVIFTRHSIELPFKINLDHFVKHDYPGTSTPMSFESYITVDNDSAIQQISMNEPMKKDGYTVYQSSYQMGEGPTASIFSINKDPGRPIKYLGSLILAFGIILHTVIRSKIGKRFI